MRNSSNNEAPRFPSRSDSLLDVMSEQYIEKTFQDETNFPFESEHLLLEYQYQQEQQQEIEFNDFYLAMQLQEEENTIRSIYANESCQSPSPSGKVGLMSYMENYGHVFDNRHRSAAVANSYQPINRKSARNQRFIEECAVSPPQPTNQKTPRDKKRNQKSPLSTSPHETKLINEGLDSKTLQLFHYLQNNQNYFSQINGCIAKGKEAVIHHAIGGTHSEVNNGSHYAIKVYKPTTTDAVYHHREKYIEGEWRFRHFAHIKNSPSKITKLWTEKELRNLKRLKANGILCPDPIFSRKHIVVMSFIGKDGTPAPQLEKVEFSKRKHQVYWKCVALMRNMYQLSDLVHADLSPYNLLLEGEEVYVIDLAQAVISQHPSALEYLRGDCWKMTKFFRGRKFDKIMTTKELFEFVVLRHVEDEVEYMSSMKLEMKKRAGGTISKEELVKEQIWMNIDLPTTLKDVVTDTILSEGMYYDTFKDLLQK